MTPPLCPGAGRIYRSRVNNVLEQLDLGAFPDATQRVAEVSQASAALAGVNNLRFFDAHEVLEQRNRLREENSDFLDHILFVAENRRGVLYGIWLRAKPSGMWTMYDPEEIDLSPAWRSTEDFIERMRSNDGAPGLPDIEGRASAEEVARFREVIVAYRANLANVTPDYFDDVMTVFFAYSVIALTPRDSVGELIPFLEFPNQWIQERAAVTLGAFRHADAAPALRALAATEGNGALAARGALESMGLG